MDPRFAMALAGGRHSPWRNPSDAVGFGNFGTATSRWFFRSTFKSAVASIPVEVEVADNDARGIAVHIASGISALAEPGEVLVSWTIKDLVSGSGLRLTERGKHSLKGLQEPMDLYAVSS